MKTNIANGAVSAAKMIISLVPRLSVLVAVISELQLSFDTKD